jgi:hypothetical protein
MMIRPYPRANEIAHALASGLGIERP